MKVKCPHCQAISHHQFWALVGSRTQFFILEPDSSWWQPQEPGDYLSVRHARCPECKNLIVLPVVSTVSLKDDADKVKKKVLSTLATQRRVKNEETV